MNKQKKRAVGRDVGTARNEFERERVEGMEKVFGGAVLFFWLCCYTDNTKGGEGRGGSFLPALGFSSFL